MQKVVRIFHPRVVLHGGGVAMVCDRDGEISNGGEHGLFAGDTRVLSSLRYGINGTAWQMLGHARQDYGSVQWHFQNAAISDADGSIDSGTVTLALARRLDGALCDELDVSAYAGRDVRLRFSLRIDADFADLFEVKKGEVPRRRYSTSTPAPGLLVLHYENNGFCRGLHVSLQADAPPAYRDGELVFEFMLAHGAHWHCRLDARPDIGGKLLCLAGEPHQPAPEHGTDAGTIVHADDLLAGPFLRGQADLRALAMPQRDAPPYVAGGIPWYLTLFGRDSLVTSLMAGIDGAWTAEGALAALAHHQATARDDFRDAAPGKLPHELRHDELTCLGKLPYSPYYGTHDAQALYCLALWNAWRWTGQRQLLDRHFDTAWRALQWCDVDGDLDGDGLQEYAPRSPKGYRNQSWKDSSSAVVDASGRQAKLPLATVELQGYLFAARLAMAELLDVRGDGAEAERQRAQAHALQERVERRYWMERDNFYAFALDGDKRQVDAIASNPGLLLWCGLASPQRAAAVARRLSAHDLSSGWGLRSLSDTNPAYNPISYQRGSVWPFDTLLAAAGLWRYGEHAGAHGLIKAILDAAVCFEQFRLPELFGGFPRNYGAPVPYHKANLPQAWSAATPLLAVQLLLGIVPDAPRGRCHFQPCLPDWLPALRVENVRVGSGSFDLSLRREGDATVVDDLRCDGIDLIRGEAPAPLWGKPMDVTACVPGSTHPTQ